ncbi:MAG: hypothetical protein Q9217_006820 [Psora testacea]
MYAGNLMLKLSLLLIAIVPAQARPQDDERNTRVTATSFHITRNSPDNPTHVTDLPIPNTNLTLDVTFHTESPSLYGPNVALNLLQTMGICYSSPSDTALSGNALVVEKWGVRVMIVNRPQPGTAKVMSYLAAHNVAVGLAKYMCVMGVWKRLAAKVYDEGTEIGIVSLRAGNAGTKEAEVSRLQTS